MSIPSITREKVLGFRQRATHLHTRLPRGRLVEAAFAGLQDSAPRSAVLALHARVKDVSPSAWKDPRFVQVWGPRGAVYVVPGQDVAVFTLGRFPRNPVLGAAVKAATEKARSAFRARQARPERHLSDRAAGVNFRELRIASMTGAVRIVWDGATTSWWLVEPPTEAAEPARLELARRFLRSVGPSTPQEFAWWSGGWAESLCERGDRWNPTSEKRSRRRSLGCPSNRRRRRSVGRRAMCPLELRANRSFTREPCHRTVCLSLVVLRMALHPPLLLIVRSEGISDRPEEHPGGRGAHVLELVLKILQQLPLALPEAGDVPLHRTVFLRQVQNRPGVLDRRADFLFIPDDSGILHQRTDVPL